MKKELDDLLYERYPAIFAERNLSPQESGMHWGFTCEDGWFDLIDTLCSQIQWQIDNNNVPPVVAKQVKEKFGGLRFYYRGGDQLIRGMVLMACAMADRTCEICGCPAEPKVEGRIMSLCRNHSSQGQLPSKDNDHEHP